MGGAFSIGSPLYPRIPGVISLGRDLKAVASHCWGLAGKTVSWSHTLVEPGSTSSRNSEKLRINTHWRRR